MSAKRTKHDELAALGEKVTEARGRARALHGAVEDKARELAALRAQRVEAYGAEDERLAKALHAKAEKAENERVELQERAEGADLAAQRASVEVDTFRAANVGVLLKELAPDAHAAAQRVQDAVQQLEDARLGLHAVSRQASAIIANLPGWNPRAIPGTDTMDGAIRSLRRDIGEVRVPLPRDLSISIAPEHDPDPAISGPARARIAAETKRREAAAAARANEQAVQNEAAQAKARR